MTTCDERVLAAIAFERAAIQKEMHELRDSVEYWSKMTDIERNELWAVKAKAERAEAALQAAQRERDALRQALEDMVRPGNPESLGSMPQGGPESHEWGRRVLAAHKRAVDLLAAIAGEKP
jgi:cell division FtsZ-interacting protein ZapD